jgi:hypothetical protein
VDDAGIRVVDLFHNGSATFAASRLGTRSKSFPAQSNSYKAGPVRLCILSELQNGKPGA